MRDVVSELNKIEDMKIKREVKMGVFGIIIIAAAYWGITFLKGLDILSSTNTFYAEYDYSDNIEVSSPVLIRGIKVGSVTDIKIQSINEPILVTMNVSSKYGIPVNSVAMITDKSMLGGKAIALQIGDSQEFLKNGDHIKGEIDNGISDQINEVKDALASTLGKLNKTLDGLNGVLSDENVSSISSTIKNINYASVNANRTISDLRVKLEDITTDLSRLTAELGRTAPQLGRTIDNLSLISDTLSVSLPELLASINVTVDDVNKTVSQINDGKGTVGKMLYDDRMYENLNNSAESLNALLTDLKANPKRYVHFSVFGRSGKAKKSDTKQAGDSVETVIIVSEESADSVN